MKKPLLAAALLVATQLPVLAQQAPTPGPAITSPLPPLASLRPGQRDTLRAIHRHYLRRRIGGYVWLGITGAGLGTLVQVLASPNTTTVNGRVTSSSVDGGAVAVVGIGFIAVPALVSISKLSRFSKAREIAASHVFLATHQLPTGWGTHIKRADYPRASYSGSAPK